ncbi:hypothetical protein AAMO2058_001510000, partial [Amorphochlora amoebiformis]
RLYAGDANGSIYVYQYENSKLSRLAKLIGRGFPCNNMKVLLDKALICGFDNGELQIVDLKTQRAVATISAHCSPVSAICTHPSQPHFVSAGEDTFVNVWAYDEGKVFLFLITVSFSPLTY